ncbi:putative membrane protein [Flavobacterium sp. W4I14]|nr:putative membrane protein [Flavobacterium sp. W4I14]
MANWKNNNNSPEKDLSSIGAMFETNKIKKMYDISELYPTKIIKLLGINSERYSVKLSNPEKFTVSEVLRLAYIFNIDPNLIINVIQAETEKKILNKIGENKAKYSK